MSGFKEIKTKSKKDRNSMVGKVACPSCNSMDTVASNVIAGTLGVIAIFCLLGVIAFFWIPIIGWIVAPIFGVVSIGCFIGYIITLLGMRYTLYCKHCEKKFKISKVKYFKLVKQNKNNNQIIINQD